MMAAYRPASVRTVISWSPEGCARSAPPLVVVERASHGRSSGVAKDASDVGGHEARLTVDDDCADLVTFEGEMLDLVHDVLPSTFWLM
jgi:hypothetical protein